MKLNRFIIALISSPIFLTLLNAAPQARKVQGKTTFIYISSETFAFLLSILPYIIACIGSFFLIAFLINIASDINNQKAQEEKQYQKELSKKFGKSDHELWQEDQERRQQKQLRKNKNKQ